MQFTKLTAKIIANLTALLLITINNCYAESDIIAALKSGTPNVNFRLRHENANAEGLLRSNATTLRSTLAYETADFNNFKLKLELVDVSNFFGQNYDPGVPELSKPERTEIQDPKGTGVTNACLQWQIMPEFRVKFGRQYLQLDNERFIGKNDFRQYPQSFDAISLSYNLLEQLNIFYAYASHVNSNVANGRSINGRRKLHANLINISWNENYWGSIKAFAYFNKDKSIASNSNIAFGAAVFADDRAQYTLGWDYKLVIARQHSRFNNPTKYSEFYWNIEFSKKIDMLTITAGIENLGDNLTTPLGSNHEFQGYADAFTTTPTLGLRDFYAKLTMSNQTMFSIYAHYHFFRLTNNDSGSKRAGYEYDLGLKAQLDDNVSATVGYARYINKGPITNPRIKRVWVSLQTSL